MPNKTFRNFMKYDFNMNFPQILAQIRLVYPILTLQKALLNPVTYKTFTFWSNKGMRMCPGVIGC